MSERARIGRFVTLLLPLLLLAAPQAQAECSDWPEPEVDWTRCAKAKKMLRDQDLSGAIFERTDLSFSSLSGSTLTGANLTRSTLTGTLFKGADLTGADLTKALGSRADFEDANLADAVMVKAEMARAKLTGADLTGADLSKAEFERANFRGAKLAQVSLRYADLARADFVGADLAGSDLTGAFTLLIRIEGTDLSGVAGLTQQQLDVACGDEATTLPDGLTQPAEWPCPAVEEE